MIATYNIILDGALAGMIVVFRAQLAGVYTNDEEIKELVAEGYMVMVCVLILHGFAMV